MFKSHYDCQNGCKLKRKINDHIVWGFFEPFNNVVLQLNDMLLVLSVIWLVEILIAKSELYEIIDQPLENL